jgi:hypothetical protein
LPASEIRALRDRFDGWVRQMQAVLEDIETVRKHYNWHGVMRTRHGGWVTVDSLLPDAGLLDTLVNGGNEIVFAFETGAPDGLLETGSIADALGTISAAFLQQSEAERVEGVTNGR